MTWQIEPFRAVGPISFGKTRGEIRNSLGFKCQTFKKTEGGNDTDAYDSLGVHIYYDEDDRVEFVEAFSPALLTFDGVLLVGEVSEVVTQLSARGYEGQQDDVGYNYFPVGIGLTVSGNDVEGVGVFKKGYYD